MRVSECVCVRACENADGVCVCVRGSELCLYSVCLCVREKER